MTRAAVKPAPTRCVALLRGINVGRAKRIAMSDLRALVEGLGYGGVRTLLNSGNVIFEAQRPNAPRIAASIAAAVHAAVGFSAQVVVVTQADLDAIVAANPLLQHADDASRLLVAFAASRAALAPADALLAQPWQPDAIAVRDRAAYLWCEQGLIESRLMQAFSRAMGDGVTTRNWATVLKLQAALQVGPTDRPVKAVAA